MFNSIFNPNNAFFRGCAKLFDLVVLSILWALLCVPLVTAGAATAALYYTVVKCVRRGEPDPYRNFLACFKQNFKTGAITGLVALALGVFGIFAYNALGVMATAGVRTAFVLYIAYTLLLILLLGVVVFMFPLLSRFTLSFSELVSRGFILALRHLPSTVVVALLVFELASFTARYVYPLLIVPGLCALLASLFFERIFLKYTPDAQTAEAAPGEETVADEEISTPWYLK